MTVISRRPSKPSSSRSRALAAALALAGAAAFAGPPDVTTPDARWRLAASGTQLTLYDAAGRSSRTYSAAALGSQALSEVSAIAHAAPRRSFVVAFVQLPELWEISLDPQAEPIFNGLVHDYKMGESIAEPGYLGVRRTRLDAPLRALAFDRSHAFVLGQAPAAADGRAVLHLVQLDIRRRIAAFVVDGEPDLAAAQARLQDGRDVIVVPDRHGAAPLVVDVRAARLHAVP